YCRRHHLFKHHSQWQVRPDPDRTVLHFTSPTGHGYSKHARQAVPPQLWIDTSGATTAEHLDLITTPATTQVNPPPSPHSGVEEFLTTLLLQHTLNTPTIEYHPGDNTWP